MSLKIEKKNEGEQQVLTFSGQVDEDAVLTESDLTHAKKIVFDLAQINSINSCGIREWIKWIKTTPAQTQLVYKNCPKVIVDQINMVAGFLPENGRVESFFVPYYAESSGEEKMILFQRGKEFKDNGELMPPSGVKSDKSGEEMEIDVIESKYFKFLKKS